MDKKPATKRPSANSNARRPALLVESDAPIGTVIGGVEKRMKGYRRGLERPLKEVL